MFTINVYDIQYWQQQNEKESSKFACQLNKWCCFGHVELFQKKGDCPLLIQQYHTRNVQLVARHAIYTLYDGFTRPDRGGVFFTAHRVPHDMHVIKMCRPCLVWSPPLVIWMEIARHYFRPSI